jgi:hypothetical protein
MRLASVVDGDERIAAEWELALFECLSKVGTLEFPDTGARNTDVIVKSRATGERYQVEITALSDKGLQEKNPVEAFVAELNRNCRGLGGAFSFNLGYVERDGELVLGVPARQDLAAFFKTADFTGYLDRIRGAPKQVHVLQFAARGAASVLSFRPGATYSSGSHITHEVLLDYERNAIVNRLRKKDDQIRKSGALLPAIVVLCDGNCRAMKMHNPGVGRLRFDEVVDSFVNGRRQPLQKPVPSSTRRINAVFVIAIEETLSGFGGVSRRFNCRYVVNRSEVVHTIQQPTLEEMARSMAHLPRIATAPPNARRSYALPAHYGGGSLTIGNAHMKAKISLLTLQGLLSGQISYDNFMQDHETMSIALRKAIADGKMISNIHIERCADEDDDWVEFEFKQVAPEHLFKDTGDA